MNTATAQTTTIRQFKVPGEMTIRAIEPRASFGLSRFVEKLNELKEETRQPEWDDGRGVAIDEPTWLLAERVAFAVAHRSKSVPQPFPSPEANGLICIRWTRSDGIDVFVELNRSEAWLTHLNQVGEGETRPLPADPVALAEEVVSRFG